MTSRLLISRAVLLVLAAVLLAGCHGAAGVVDGAVHPWRQNGVPFATVGWVSVRPGRTMDFDVYVVNDAGHPVAITGARLIRLPGHRVGRLAQVALETGQNRVGANRGWPPKGVSSRPLLRRDLPPGRSAIAVGMSAARPGVFVAAGLLLTYHDGPHTGQVHAWGGGFGCFSNRGTGKLPPPCPDRVGNRTDTALSDFIHQQ